MRGSILPLPGSCKTQPSINIFVVFCLFVCFVLFKFSQRSKICTYKNVGTKQNDFLLVDSGSVFYSMSQFGSSFHSLWKRVTKLPQYE